MNTIPIPEWVKDLKEQDEAEQSRIELRRLSQLQAERAVTADGPNFFRDLIEAISVNVTGIQMLGICGSVTKVIEDKREWQWRITVERRSALPKSTWVNIFYAPGDKSIRLLARNLNTILGQPSELTLCDVGGKVGVVSEELPAGSSAREAAELIVQQMVAAIRA